MKKGLKLHDSVELSYSESSSIYLGEISCIGKGSLDIYVPPPSELSESIMSTNYDWQGKSSLIIYFTKKHGPCLPDVFIKKTIFKINNYFNGMVIDFEYLLCGGLGLELKLIKQLYD